MKRILKADWVAPMDRAGVGALRGQSVAIDGDRILAIGTPADLVIQHPDAMIEDLGDVVLLPGLVNPHTHLELSDCKAGSPPACGFATWLLQLITRTANAGATLPTLVDNAVAEGVSQCLRFGVTTVGDITRQSTLTRPLLGQSPLRVTSYGEIQALAQRRGSLEERLAAALDDAGATPRLRIGLTPHAPYTVEPAGYARCLAIARAASLPLATHLAESPDEATFLSCHTGPFRELWETLNAWDDRVPRFDGGPIRLAQSLGLLNYTTLLAHVNYCDDDELAILAGGRASVVWCPRTHRYFGHPPHRWREMLARGINVAIGTDSCASSPDLNLVDDLRLAHEQSPERPIDELWRMITVNAARAMQAEEVGRIAPGRYADFVAFPANGDDPLRSILESAALPTAAWIGGAALHPNLAAPPEFDELSRVAGRVSAIHPNAPRRRGG